MHVCTLMLESMVFFSGIEMEMLVTEQFHIKIQNLQNVRNNQYVIYVQHT